MKKYRVCAVVIAAVILSGCAKKAAYEVFDRKEDGLGIVVNYRVGVPRNPSREDLQGWCTDITEAEGENKIVNIEFVDKVMVGQQQALCMNGDLHTIAELNRMPVLPGSSP